MTGTILKDLRDMLKAEIGYGVGTASSNAELDVLLSNKQKWLASGYDWPFLESRWTVSVATYSRYINIPSADDLNQPYTFDRERPLTVEVRFNEVWEPVDYGIGAAEFVYRDSDLNEGQDPVQRWRYQGTDQFEVWPLATSPQQVRFTGQRAMKPLVADTDKADLDDMLLVYFVAAEKLKRLKQEDWVEKQTLAKERFLQLRSVYPQRTQDCVLGGDRLHRGSRWQRVVPIVTVAKSQ